MPLYNFHCEKGHHFTRFLKLADYDSPQVCECQAPAERQLSAPAVIGDYQGYSCPVTGRWIEGRRAHQENLKRTGCRILEPGETKAAQRRFQENDSKLERAIESTAEAFVEKLSGDERAALGQAIESGVDVQIGRG